MDTDSDSASDFHQTPHLEKLANRGMKFSAYAAAHMHSFKKEYSIWENARTFEIHLRS